MSHAPGRYVEGDRPVFLGASGHTPSCVVKRHEGRVVGVGGRRVVLWRRRREEPPASLLQVYMMHKEALVDFFMYNPGVLLNFVGQLFVE